MTRLFFLAAIVAAAAHAAPSADFGNAQWIRDPRMEGLKPVNLEHREAKKGPEPKGPQNIHTLFRREITLAEKPASAMLAVTADDYCKVFFNGFRVVQGPESGPPPAHPYYLLDVTSFLEAGTNCLAAHVFYQGLLNRVWNSADNRSGFLFHLVLTHADGRSETISSDGSWKCLPLDAFTSMETTGYKTQFVEDMDLRKMPEGWRAAGFDDSGWATPAQGALDHVLVRQITPPLQVYSIQPPVAKALGGGRYFYDFGQEIAGHTRIRITGPEGHVMTVRHGEELSGPDAVRFEMRASTRYEERITLSGREDLAEFYDYRAFRYMEILDAPAEPKVWVDVRHHPFDPARSTFTSADQSLQDIWTICRNGVWMGSQGGFLDCPTREKGQYLGDAVITSRSHLWLTADPALTLKCLTDFALSQRICPGMMAVAPGSFMQEIAEFSLQYPLMLRNYYLMTGDRRGTEHLVDQVFGPLFGYFGKFENRHGLLEGITKEKEKWLLVDWPANLRDDYDYDYSMKRANTVLNGFYYGALRAAAQLARELGRDGGAWDARADRVAKAFAEQFVDPATGLYLDAPGSSHSSLHANAVPLSFGLHAGADKDKMLAFIRDRQLACGVYIASYVIEACFKSGAPDLGYALLTADGEHSWKEMLRHGATTCMEAWGPDQKKNTSWCHPWSSSPIYLIAEHVLGLSPAEPGWKKIRIAPPPIANLPEMTLKVPIPQGVVTMTHTPGKGFTAQTPEGVPVESAAPEGSPVRVESRLSHARPAQTEAFRAALERAGWEQRVGQGRGVVVSVPDQVLYVVERGAPVWQARCATAAAGVGSLEGSNKTPAGWHKVAEKIGDGAPWGQVFRSRAATAEIWQPGRESAEDLVLTRLMWLEGLEPGINQGKDKQGKNVDSRARCIYIHGTNGEKNIGTPSSHGCVRLLNDDVIALYGMVEKETPVFILGE